MKKFLCKSLIGILSVYVVLIALMFTFQRSLMYFPQGPVADAEIKEVFKDMEILQLKTEDNIELKFYMEPPANEKSPIILAFHGNGSLALSMYMKFLNLKSEGAGVLYPEYRGYGGNAGAINEVGLYKDADAYLAYLKIKYPNNPIILYGQSLGSGVAVDLASRHIGQYKGLVLEVPFDSVVNVVGDVYPFVPFKSLLLHDKYASIEKIGFITVPKLFLIAGQDDVVGAESGRRLFAAADSNKKWVEFPDANHFNVFQFGAEKAVQDFIQNDVMGAK